MSKHTNTIITIVILVLVFFNIKNCTDSNYLSENYDKIKNDYEVQKIKIVQNEKIVKQKSDSLKKEIELRENKNKVLISKRENIKKLIVTAKTKKINKIKDSLQLVSYFNKRYNTEKNKLVDSSMLIPNNVGYNVSYELAQKDSLYEVSYLLQKQIDIQSEQLFDAEQDKYNYQSLINSIEKENEEYKHLNALADNNIESLIKQSKSKNKQATLNKILIPIVIIASFLAIIKI